MYRWTVDVLFLDFRILKPLLTHSRPTLMETLPACCLPITRLLTTEEQLLEVLYSVYSLLIGVLTSWGGGINFYLFHLDKRFLRYSRYHYNYLYLLFVSLECYHWIFGKKIFHSFFKNWQEVTTVFIYM